MPAAPSARQQRAGATRERLLALAFELVRTEGASAFTIRRLAEDARVAVGLPHARFGSREALLDLLRIRVWDEIDAVVGREVGEVETWPDDGRLEDRIRRGLERVVRFALEEPRLFDLVLLKPGMHVSEAVFLRDATTAQRFVRALVLGEERGLFRFAGTDPIVFALALWTSVQGWIQRMGAEMPPLFRSYHDQVLGEILDTYFARIRRPPARPARKRGRRKRR